MNNEIHTATYIIAQLDERHQEALAPFIVSFDQTLPLPWEDVKNAVRYALHLAQPGRIHSPLSSDGYALYFVQIGPLSAQLFVIRTGNHTSVRLHMLAPVDPQQRATWAAQYEDVIGTSFIRLGEHIAERIVNLLGPAARSGAYPVPLCPSTPEACLTWRMFYHPEWTDQQLSKASGFEVQSLYNAEQRQRARGAPRVDRRGRPRKKTRK